MQLFYNSTLKPHDTNFCFDKNESRHIVKVLRKKIGDKLLIANGVGYFFEADILFNNPSKCEVKITKVTPVPAKEYNIHLAVAPTKTNDRYEWFLEKATEIGIHQITPLICDHSERKVIKAERLDKIIVAALKQSKQFYKPVLNPLISFKDFVAAQPKAYIAHCHPEEKKGFFGAIAPKDNITVLIGPEGDFSLKEVSIALENNYTAISLGEQRLRTETAGVIAAHSVALRAQ